MSDHSPTAVLKRREDKDIGAQGIIIFRTGEEEQQQKKGGGGGRDGA